MKLDRYNPGDFYDEVFEAMGKPRPPAGFLVSTLESMAEGELARRQLAAEKAFLDLGITFNVYNSNSGLERIFPFDILPRIIEASEWEFIERGLRQRIHALNLFLDDIYHDQRIVKDGIVPFDLIRSATGYRKECQGLNPPWGVWCHITGTDLVKDGDGKLYVLEDNIRCPSGVSYVIGNRQVMKRTFPQIFGTVNPRPVEDYPSRLLDMLQFMGQRSGGPPSVAILTPGVYNSAYFEHSFLAQQMGVDLVTGSDLTVRDGYLFMRTTRGLKRVDVLYRRIDDDFLDPRTFRTDSLLGRARPDGRVPRGQGGHLQRARHRRCGRQGHLRLRAANREVLPGRGNHPAQRGHLYVLGSRRARIRAGAHVGTGDQDRQRFRRLRRAHRTAFHQGRARRMGRPHQGQSPQLHRPAHPVAVPFARDRGGPVRRPPRGSAPVRTVRPGHLRDARRPDARGPQEGIPGGELLPGRRQQGHLGDAGRPGHTHAHERNRGPRPSRKRTEPEVPGGGAAAEAAPAQSQSQSQPQTKNPIQAAAPC